jgi:hypothetical protein
MLGLILFLLATYLYAEKKLGGHPTAAADTDASHCAIDEERYIQISTAVCEWNGKEWVAR